MLYNIRVDNVIAYNLGILIIGRAYHNNDVYTHNNNLILPRKNKNIIQIIIYLIIHVNDVYSVNATSSEV